MTQFIYITNLTQHHNIKLTTPNAQRRLAIEVSQQQNLETNGYPNMLEPEVTLGRVCLLLWT